jgi:hypothetical protein
MWSSIRVLEIDGDIAALRTPRGRVYIMAARAA